MSHKLGYKNAADILPDDLVNEIRKHFPGGILWVPKTGLDTRERDELIVDLKKNGVTTKELAALAKLTPRHIRRIVLKHDRRGTGADIN